MATIQEQIDKYSAEVDSGRYGSAPATESELNIKLEKPDTSSRYMPDGTRRTPVATVLEDRLAPRVYLDPEKQKRLQDETTNVYSDPIVQEMIGKYTREAEGNVKVLQNLSGHIGAFQEAWTQADVGIDQSRLWYKVWNGTATPTDKRKIKELDVQMEASRQRTVDDPFVAKSAGTIGPFLKESVRTGGKAYLWGFLAGAGIAAAGGALVPGAEEIVTVPAFGHMTGKVAGLFNSSENMRQLETGSSFGEQIKADIHPDIARWTAGAYGVASTGIELAQAKILTRLIPGGDKLAKTAVRKAVQKATEKFLSYKGAKLATSLSGIVRTPAAEATIEATQKILENISAEIGKQLNDEFQGTDLGPDGIEDLTEAVLKDVGATWATTLVGMGVFAIPGTSINLIVDATGKINMEKAGPETVTAEPEKDLLESVQEILRVKEEEAIVDEQAQVQTEPQVTPEPTPIESAEAVVEEVTPAVEEEVDVAPIEDQTIIEENVELFPDSKITPVTEEAIPIQETTVVEPKIVSEKVKEVKPEKLKALPFNKMTQPAVRDIESGEIVMGPKVEGRSPSQATAESIQTLNDIFTSTESIARRYNEAPQDKLERGFMDEDGNFRPLTTLISEKQKAKVIEAGKIRQKKAEKKRKAEAAKKEAAKPKPKTVTAPTDFTPAQKKIFDSYQKKIKGAARNKAGKGIDADELANVANEALIEHVRTKPNEKWTPKFAMTNFINTQLTKGTAPRTAQQAGTAPRFEDADESTGTTKRAPAVKLEQAVTEDEKAPSKPKTITKEQRLAQIADATKRKQDENLRLLKLAKTKAGSTPILSKGAKGGLVAPKADERGQAGAYDAKKASKKKDVAVDTKPQPKKITDTQSYSVEQVKGAMNEAGLEDASKVREVTVDPATYLNLTTATNKRKGAIIAKAPSTYSETEMKKSDAILLVVEQDGRVVAHDGRHRAATILKAEVGNVPTILIPANENVDVSKITTLKAQQFGKQGRMTTFNLNRPIKTQEDIVIPKPKVDVDRKTKEQAEKSIQDAKDVSDLNKEYTKALKKGATQATLDAIQKKLQDKFGSLSNEAGSSALLTNAAEVGVKMWNKAADLLDVEAPMIRMGAPEVGTAVKGYQGVRKFYEDRAAAIAKVFVQAVKRAAPEGLKGKPFRTLMGQIVLAAETTKTHDKRGNEIGMSMEDRSKYDTAIQIMRTFFEAAKKEYERYGITDIGFIENMIKRQRMIVMAATNFNARNRALQRLSELRNLRFIHIPSMMWWAANEAVTGKTKREKVRIKRRDSYKLLVKERKRHALSIADLVNKKVMKIEEVNPIEIFLNYGHQQGKDFGKARVRNAAAKTGFAKKQTAKPKTPRSATTQIVALNETYATLTDEKKKKAIEKKIEYLESHRKKVDENFEKFGESEWVKLSKEQESVFEGYWLDTRLVEALNGMAIPDDPRSIWQKGVSYTKMAQFYNPVFMPIYDIQQSFVFAGGALNPTLWTKSLKKGIKDVYGMTQDFEDATMHGTFSQPYSNPFRSIEDMVLELERVSKNNGPMAALYNQLTRSMVQVEKGRFDKAIYNASWNTAWKMDQMIRMGTYNMLRAQGFSKHEAAQTAAKAHADYASVPAATRRAMNKLFFTPTFAISMGKVAMAMVTNSLRVAMGGSPKGNINQRLALGGALTLGTLVGARMLMQGLGYDNDEFGRRWTKTIPTPEGPKEIVITWNTPLNKMVKYMYWLMSVGEFSVNKPQELGSKLQWELTPLIRTAMSVYNNEDSMTRQPIYNSFDEDWEKPLKIAAFVVKDVGKILSAYSQITGSNRFPGQNERQRKALIDSLPWFVNFMTRIQMMSVYARKTPPQRRSGQMRYLNQTFGRDVKRMYNTQDQPDRKEIRQWQEKYGKEMRKVYKSRYE